MSKTVILGTARTPFGKMGGAFAAQDATELGGRAIEAALERAEVDADRVQQVIFGQVLQAGQGQIPSRQAQVEAGVPKEVPSETVNKVCASGMRTIGIADQAIRAGDLEIGVAGGMESMSNAPYLLPGARFGFRMGDKSAVDAMTHDGLTNPFTGKQMINEASEVSNELEITRPDMDRWAARSHQLAARATDEGKLAEEIVSVTVKSRKSETVVEADEAIRPDSTVESLAKLPGIGGDDATHTAGNAPGVNDGAAAVVVAADEWAQANGATAAGDGALLRPDRRRLRLPRADAGQGRTAGAGEDRQVARRRRSLGDQRGLRLGRAELAADARRRRGQRQRQRRRDRARTPDRRLGRAHRRRARSRAPPPRRRHRLRRDLLRRRPGRRDRAGGGCAIGTGAAFFDLDRTLIAGSSGQPWARAAMRAGLISRRQMAQWAVDGIRFRIRGSTDEATERVLAEIKRLLTGVPERDLARMAPEVLGRVLPRLYPEMLDEVHAHMDAGRRTFIVSAAGDEIVKLIARVLYMDGGIGTAYAVDPEGRYTGELSGAFMYGEGKVEAMRRYADEHAIDLVAVVGVLGLGLGPADAARGRQPRRRQPRRRAGADRARGQLAGDALRAPRSPAGDRRGDAGRGCGRRGGQRHRPPPGAGSSARKYARAVDGSDLAFAGIARQAQLIAAGEISSRELTELYLQRIEDIGDELNAFTVVLAERALAEADEADRRGRGGGDRPRIAARRSDRDQGHRGRRRRGHLLRHRSLRSPRGRRRPAGAAADRRRAP